MTVGESSMPSGIVIIGGDRTIEFSTPAGDVWLERLRAAEPDEHAVLPPAIWSVVKGFRRQSDPVLRIDSMTPNGSVVLEASAGGQDATAIVVTPRRPEPLLELPEHWGLTEQQREIVLQLIGGASNRDIASRLFLTEHTVEWHLRQIYRTLDLSSRTQLQARFFRDAGFAGYRDIVPESSESNARE